MIDTEKYAAATVVSRRDLATDLWVVRIRPDCELPFRPGQYVTLGLELDGRIVERPYSIASDPAEDEIELFIERVPEGELSAPLHDVPIGETTLVRKRCKGLFLKDAPVLDQPHLFVATVTGIAPFVSILRSLRRRQESGEWTADQPVIALQGASRSEELGYEDELRAPRHGLRLVHLRAHHQPAVGRPRVDRGDRPGRGRAAQARRRRRAASGPRRDLPVRTSRDDRQQPRHHAPARLRRQGDPRGAVLARLRRRGNCVPPSGTPQLSGVSSGDMKSPALTDHVRVSCRRRRIHFAGDDTAVGGARRGILIPLRSIPFD